jgi:hypothetical protein
LTICRMTECSASVAGGKEILLFCEKVTKDDIQVTIVLHHVSCFGFPFLKLNYGLYHILKINCQMVFCFVLDISSD